MCYQREADRRLRVGMVGIGHHAYRTLLPTLHYLPVELIAVSARRDEERAAETAREYGCRCYMSSSEMYTNEDLDAVFVCVGPEHHPTLICEAFDAGLHVWVEKPPAESSDELEEVIRRRGDRVCVVGFKKVFMPVTEKAREILGSNDYGRLKSLTAVYPVTVPTAASQDPDTGGRNTWLSNGVHPLSLLLSLGGEARSVTAHTSESGHGTVIIRFEDDVIGTLILAPNPYPAEIYTCYGKDWACEIAGSTAFTLYRDYGAKGGSTFIPGGFDSGSVVWRAQDCYATLENHSLFTQGFYAEMKHFCDCVLCGAPNRIGSLEFALRVLQVHEAALSSRGRAVELGQES